VKPQQSTAVLAWLGDLLPPPTPGQVRQHLRLGLVLRWVVIAIVAAGGMLTPQMSGMLLYLLLAATIYNGSATLVVARAPAGWHRRIALAVTVIDQLFSFVFLGLYSSHVATSQPLGGYSMATIEAVAYFGVAGALLSVGTFIACAVVVHATGLPLFGQTFTTSSMTVNSVLLVGTVAVVLVAVLRTLLDRGEASATVEGPIARAPAGGVRLSRREHEVLSLVAEGYSNSMIATRLQLSESTVKGYIENLLFHLNARNRAEAVAAASRLKLL
jgi:DNA-binding CsgD family transcriptional regulator